MEVTVGMYGELQAIAGKSLGEIEGLAIQQDSHAVALVGDEVARRSRAWIETLAAKLATSNATDA